MPMPTGVRPGNRYPKKISTRTSFLQSRGVQTRTVVESQRREEFTRPSSLEVGNPCLDPSRPTAGELPVAALHVWGSGRYQRSRQAAQLCAAS